MTGDPITDGHGPDSTPALLVAEAHDATNGKVAGAPHYCVSQFCPVAQPALVMSGRISAVVCPSCGAYTRCVPGLVY